VLIDSSPGFGDNVLDVIRASDKVLVITTPNIPDVTDASKIVQLAKQMRKKVFIVVNRIKREDYELEISRIKRMLKAPILAVIPEDEKVPESISKGLPLVVYKKGSKASIAFKRLAASLIGKKYKPRVMDRIKWFFGF